MISVPQIKSIIARLERIEGKADALEPYGLYRIFDQIDSIVAMGPNKWRSIWLTADRGTIQDFARYDDYIDEASFRSNPDECRRVYNEYYPQKDVWIKLLAYQVPSGERVICLDDAKIYDETIKTGVEYLWLFRARRIGNVLFLVI